MRALTARHTQSWHAQRSELAHAELARKAAERAWLCEARGRRAGSQEGEGEGEADGRGDGSGEGARGVRVRGSPLPPSLSHTVAKLRLAVLCVWHTVPA